MPGEQYFCCFPGTFLPPVPAGLIISVRVGVISKNHFSFQCIQRVIRRILQKNDLDHERIAAFPVRINVPAAFPGEVLIYSGKNVIALPDIVFRMQPVLFIAQYVNTDRIHQAAYRRLPHPEIDRIEKNPGIYFVGIIGQRTDMSFDVK